MKVKLTVEKKAVSRAVNLVDVTAAWKVEKKAAVRDGMSVDQ